MAIYLPSIRQLPAPVHAVFGSSGLVRKEQFRKIQQAHDEICLTSQYLALAWTLSVTMKSHGCFG
jgi:hypothetical protein